MEYYLDGKGSIIIEGDFPTEKVTDGNVYIDKWLSGFTNLSQDELNDLGIISSITYQNGTVDNYYDWDIQSNGNKDKPISKEQYDQYSLDFEHKYGANKDFITQGTSDITSLDIGEYEDENGQSGLSFEGDFDTIGNVDGKYAGTSVSQSIPGNMSGINLKNKVEASGIKEVHNPGYLVVTPGPTLGNLVDELNKNVSIEDIKSDIDKSKLSEKVKKEVNDWLDMTYLDEEVSLGNVVIDVRSVLKKGIEEGVTDLETASSIISIVAEPLVKIFNVDDSVSTSNDTLNKIDKVAKPVAAVLSVLALSGGTAAPILVMAATALEVYSMIVSDEMKSSVDFGLNYDKESGTGILSVTYESGISTISHQIDIDLNDINLTFNQLIEYAHLSRINLMATLNAIPMSSKKNIENAQRSFHNEMSGKIEEHQFIPFPEGSRTLKIVKEAYGIDYNYSYSIAKFEEGITLLKKDMYTVYFDVENQIFNRYKTTVEEEIVTQYSTEYNAVTTGTGYYKSGNIYLGRSSDKYFIDYDIFFIKFKSNYYRNEIYNESNIQTMRDFIKEVANDKSVVSGFRSNDSYMSATNNLINYDGIASEALDNLDKLCGDLILQMETAQSGVRKAGDKDKEISEGMGVTNGRN